MIIDKTKLKYKDLPESLDGEVLLEANENGFLTCDQEVAYMYSVATDEQKTISGHINYDYSTLDINKCKKPTLDYIDAMIKQFALYKIENTTMTVQAKAALISRVTNLVNDMQSLPDLDDSIRLALELSIDVEKA